MTSSIGAATTPPTSSTTAQSSVISTVKHMAGMLWDEMLSELNQTGFSSDALGTGGGDFQSMFLWNVAQNDFGKYDTQLTDAAVAQLGGGAHGAAGSAAGSTAAAAAAIAPGAPMAGAAPSLPSSGLPAGAAIAAVLATASPAPAAAPGTTTGASTGASTGATGENASGQNLTGPTLDRAVAYAKQVWPQVSAAAQTLGVSPVAILAQSALETGWGAATAGNNFFGIKAAPGEGGTSRPTHEVVDGVLQAQTASFRDYSSPTASVADYVGLIQSGFQSAVGQTSVAGFAQTLQANGYATDRSYAAKIVGIAQSPLMQHVLAALPEQSSAGASE